MPEFTPTELLPLGADTTEYRLLTGSGVTTRQAFGRKFIEVPPELLTLVAREGMRDIAHLLRPGHLRQLRAILDDPEASPNDRYVARDLLQNACIAAGGCEGTSDGGAMPDRLRPVVAGRVTTLVRAIGDENELGGPLAADPQLVFAA